MNLMQLPWVEIAIAIALIGSVSVSRLRDPERASRWGLAFTGLSFVCALLAWLSFYVGTPAALVRAWSLQPYLFGLPPSAPLIFRLDEVSAPLLPTVAL